MATNIDFYKNDDKLFSLFSTGVVELHYHDNQAKSFLLTHLIQKCIQPVELGGKNSRVMYLDLNFHFDIFQLASSLENKTNGTEEEVKTWLTNLYLAKCSNYEELLITLHSIEHIIANSKIPFSIIIIDSLTSFFWSDKNCEMRDSVLVKIIEILQILKNKYNINIVATTSRLVVNKEEGKQKPLLIDQWQKFIMQKYVITCKTLSPKLSFILNCIYPKHLTYDFIIPTSL